MKSNFIKGSICLLTVSFLLFSSSCAAFKKQRCDMCPEFTEVDKQSEESQLSKIENEKNVEVFN